MQYSTKTLNQNTLMAIAGTLAFCTPGFGGEITTSNLSAGNGRQATRMNMLSEQEGILCGSETITQSTNTTAINPNSVWCGDISTNDETSLARAFVAPFDLTLKCVDFGISQNTGGDAVVHVRVLVGSPLSAYTDLTLVSSVDVIVAGGSSMSLESVDIPDVQIPMGSQFIIELNTPSRFAVDGGDGGLLSFGTNTLGQSSPTYLRGPTCGSENFTDTASFGFGDRHLVMSLGVDSGIATTVLGGFPMTSIGSPIASSSGNELIVVGAPVQGEFGGGIHYGDTTSGVSSSVRVDSGVQQAGATVSASFIGQAGVDRLMFSDFQGDSTRAILNLDFDNSAFDIYDVHVYDDGQFVGVLSGLSSGILFEQSDGESEQERAIGWIIALIGLVATFECQRDIQTTTLPDGTVVEENNSYYGFRGGHRSIVSNDDEQSLDGDEIRIFPASSSSTAGVIPQDFEFVVSGIDGFVVDLDENGPAVTIGNAQTSPSTIDINTVNAQVGVPFTLNGIGSDVVMFAEDVDGDGVADLSIESFGTLFAVDMVLGGVDSATIEIDMDTSIIPCLSICPWWDNGSTILVPGCKLDFDPWPNPFGDDLFGVLPDFEAIGDGSYTVQYWNDGQLVGESFMSGIAGGTSQLPIMLGVINDDQQLGFSAGYPSQTEFTTADGQSITMDEIHVIVDSQGSTNSLALFTLQAEGLDGVILSLPTTVVASQIGCRADITGDGDLNFFDVSAFLQAFGQQDPIADFSDDGSWNFFDVSAFLQAFSAGCP